MLSTKWDSLKEHSQRLRAKYQELDAAVDDLLRHGGHDMDPIQIHLQEIKRIENALHPLREQFTKSETALPESLQQTTRETIDIVQGLMPKLAQLEKNTLVAAERLYPQIQQGVRAVQMQNAYGAQAGHT